jgi:predicted benzoate:H+ symporter BenE
MATASKIAHLRKMWAHNMVTFRRQPLAEISGSLGDLGTFLPICIALTEGGQISLATTLIFTGVYNILTGLVFGIPLPVQPMKAIAAVAILNSLSASAVATAGLFVSICIFLFGVTGLLERFTRIIPIPVVKGIQVGAGLSLVIAAGTKALSSLTWLGPSWADNHLWLIAAFLALCLLNLRPRTPYALLVLILGLVFAFALTDRVPRPRIWHPSVRVPALSAWTEGILSAGLGQLPLTTLNSVIAVTHLAADLLPQTPTPSVTAIGVSVASMNLIGCWFGAMPACHGSGGLAAQYRFGARSGASVMFLGLLKVILGLAFGDSLTSLLQRFPLALLTVMIIAAGLELASVGESLNTERARDLVKENSLDRSPRALSDEDKKRRWTVMMITAGTLVAFKNDGIGFIAGLVCHASFSLEARIAKVRQGSHAEREPLLSQA